MLIVVISTSAHKSVSRKMLKNLKQIANSSINFNFFLRASHNIVAKRRLKKFVLPLQQRSGVYEAFITISSLPGCNNDLSLAKIVGN